MPLPAGGKLIVVEETATTNYLVLPAAATGELSETELQAVAGGTGVLDGWVGQTDFAKTGGVKGSAFKFMGNT
jgi:hypothetical protein